MYPEKTNASTDRNSLVFLCNGICINVAYIPERPKENIAQVIII
jgi:hypothetical protein